MKFEHPVGTCPDCGKLRFVSRKAAKGHARKAHPDERLGVYQCGTYFHFGHQPYVVRRGQVAR